MGFFVNVLLIGKCDLFGDFVFCRDVFVLGFFVSGFFICVGCGLFEVRSVFIIFFSCYFFIDLLVNNNLKGV